MKRVGRSRVSAITQTPASGPFALLTTPPRSLSPTLTPAGGVCCSLTGAGGAPKNAASAIAATPKYRPVLIVMTAPPVSSRRALCAEPARTLHLLAMHKPRPFATRPEGLATHIRTRFVRDRFGV